MQVTTQCRVDAPLDWVRAFLVAGTTDDDVTIEGDVVEVHQRDRFIHLVVRNALTPAADGATLLDIEANLQLRGFGVIAGTLFRRRLRRTLVSSLDALPTAIEVALEQADRQAALAPDRAPYADGTADRSDSLTEVT
ncbi:MAG: hypothetical protein M3R48_03200 [Candidatus Dormibacteraeota bacterium]|nr:hypothetical protein [Candidatus Dormibacteraeota bacterium]